MNFLTWYSNSIRPVHAVGERLGGAGVAVVLQGVVVPPGGERGPQRQGVTPPIQASDGERNCGRVVDWRGLQRSHLKKKKK